MDSCSNPRKAGFRVGWNPRTLHRADSTGCRENTVDWGNRKLVWRGFRVPPYSLHGMASGVMSTMGGDKFGYGFASAAGTQLSSVMIDQIGNGAASYKAPRPKRQQAFGGGVAKDQGSARNIAKSNATHNLGCQPKHVSCKCLGPKGETYAGGC